MAYKSETKPYQGDEQCKFDNFALKIEATVIKSHYPESPHSVAERVCGEFKRTFKRPCGCRGLLNNHLLAKNFVVHPCESHDHIARKLLA